jgi:hypothetical protein
MKQNTAMAGLLDKRINVLAIVLALCALIVAIIFSFRVNSLVSLLESSSNRIQNSTSSESSSEPEEEEIRNSLRYLMMEQDKIQSELNSIVKTEQNIPRNGMSDAIGAIKQNMDQSAIKDAYIKFLDDEITAERTDGEFTSSTIRYINQKLMNDSLIGSSVTSATCSLHICKVQISVVDLDQRENILGRISTFMPSSANGYASIDDSDGLLVSVFFARPDEHLQTINEFKNMMK